MLPSLPDCYSLVGDGGTIDPFTTIRPLLILYSPSDASSGDGWATVVKLACEVYEELPREIFVLSREKPGDTDPGPFTITETEFDAADGYDLLIFQNSAAPETLPTHILDLLCRLDLRRIRFVDTDLNLSIYVRPVIPDRPRVLFLFPGVFAPPSLGSHQRALSLVLQVISSGWEIDLVYTSVQSRALNNALRYMRLLSAKPTAAKARRQGQRRSLRRKLYELVCGIMGKKTTFPLTMQEQAARFVSPNFTKLLRGMLASTDYAAIITSYAWMLPVLKNVNVGSAKIICDTHDVQFFRLRNFRNSVTDKLFPESAERSAELAELSRCDRVLAISGRDAKILRSDLRLDNVFETPMAYGFHPRRFERRRKPGPLQFGFLGSRMEANRLALDFVLDAWWHGISNCSPDSKLHIAGTVSKGGPILKRKIFLREDIITHGFVKDPNKFLNSIDVLLSPVIIAGGLNIKNAEALAAGCIVITNKLGAEALQPLRLPTVCETGAEVVELIRRIETDDTDLTQQLEKLQQEIFELRTENRLQSILAD